MVTQPTQEQHRLFKTLDNGLKWRVAKAYRDGMLQKIGENTARWNAIDVMREAHPDLPMDQVQSIVAYIIVRAAQLHKEWMQGGRQG